MAKKAVITGITGQDGAYLAKLLLDKGYEVYGAYRRTSDLNLDRLKRLGVERDIKLAPFELLEFSNIRRTIEKISPDEIYNLAAQSFVSLSFEEPIFTADVTGLGVIRVLESIRSLGARTKFYQASSSEMFGRVVETPQNEKTRFYPRSPYAVAKLFGHSITVNYRESYGIFACCGILFNHESPLRGPEFVTRKITRGVARIKLGLEQKITLGNLDAKRDWGYAPEYVEAMYLMMQYEKPDDYVVATGQTNTIRDFLRCSFEHVGIKTEFAGEGVGEKCVEKGSGRVLVDVSPEFFRPAEVDLLIGDAAKARETLGWQPRVRFEELVGIMLDSDLLDAEREKKNCQ